MENRKSNATGVPAILTRVCGRFAVLTLTSPFEKGGAAVQSRHDEASIGTGTIAPDGVRGISPGLKSPLAPLKL